MVVCATALLAAGCSAGHGTVPAARGAAVPVSRSAAPLAAARACGSLPGFDQAAADGLTAGRLTIAPFPAVTIDPHRDGDINWQLDPFGHPTWSGDFRSGGWIEMLVSGYLAGGPGAQAYRARAKAITMSWLRGVPVSVRDPGTLICISEAFPGQPWIQDKIVSSVDYYAGALAGGVESRAQAGPGAAAHRLRLPGAGIRRRRAGLAADGRAADDRRVRAEPAGPGDRCAGRAQRAGDAV
jgi:hypothetical protein